MSAEVVRAVSRDVFEAELRELLERRKAAGFNGSQSHRPQDGTQKEPLTEEGLPDNYHEQFEADARNAGSFTTGGSPAATESAAPDDAGLATLRDRVGLALSGGGIRSASFNLGFLQALYHRGLLRHFDYLSTVSGGGYVGSFLTSMAAHPKSQLAWGPEQGTSAAAGRNGNPHSESPFDLAPTEEGKQPPAIRQLIRGGRYLRRPLLFVNRYLFGLLAVNAVIFCGLLAAAALAAFVFRCLDYPRVMDVLAALGFQGDVRRAFFPAFVFLVLWALSWAWRLVLNRRAPIAERLSRAACLGMLVSGTLAFVALLVTGDISLRDPTRDAAKSVVNRAGEILAVVLLTSQFLAMLPFLRLNTLLRSGTQPRNVLDSVFFNVVGAALVFGLPLLLFGMFAREDLAGIVRTRAETVPPVFRESAAPPAHARLDHRHPYLLSPQHVKDWSAFWRMVERQARRAEFDSQARREAPVLVERVLSAAGLREKRRSDVTQLEPSRALWDAADRYIDRGGYEITLAYSVSRDRDYRDHIDRTWLWQYWVGVLPTLVGNKETAVRRAYQLRRDRRRAFDEVIDRVNQHCLHDPQFHRHFAAFEASAGDARSLPPTADPRRIASLREEARGLEQKWNDHLFAGGDPPVSLQRELHLINRELLQAYYGDDFLHDMGAVFAHNVTTADQLRRVEFFVLFGTLCLLGGWLLSLNGTSLHGFYRTSLARAWIVGEGAVEKDIPLQDLSKIRTAEADARSPSAGLGSPYLLVNATVHVTRRSRFGPWIHGIWTALRDSGLKLWHASRSRLAAGPDASGTGETPHGRNKGIPDLPCRDDGLGSVSIREIDSTEGRMLRFLFSSRYCGSRTLGYICTPQYSRFSPGMCDLAGAMTLSGSAVNPMMTRSVILRVILTLSNLRLGQWLPNPVHLRTRRNPLLRFLFHRPTLLKQTFELLFRAGRQAEFVFLSDGGHFENLGLEALLDRRTRVIVVVDAGHDPDCCFTDLLKIIRRCRAMNGIRITVADDFHGCRSLDAALDLLKGRIAKRHFIVARIEYPAEDGLELTGSARTAYQVTQGYLVYVKPTFSGDEDAELSGYRDENPVFPYDPTIDQFYDERRFECYRQLGEHIGDDVADMLEAGGRGDPAQPWLSGWQPGPVDPPSLPQLHPDSLRVPPLVDESNVEIFREVLHSPNYEARRIGIDVIRDSGPQLPHEPTRRALVLWLRDALARETCLELQLAIVEALGGFHEESDLVEPVFTMFSRATADPAMSERMIRFSIAYAAERLKPRQTRSARSTPGS